MAEQDRGTPKIRALKPYTRFDKVRRHSNLKSSSAGDPAYQRLQLCLCVNLKSHALTEASA